MNLTDQLHSHKGRLICLQSSLFWHESHKWEKAAGKVCLVLDVWEATKRSRRTTNAATLAALNSMLDPVSQTSLAVVQLLIDGMTRWVWVSQNDVQFLRT